MFGRCLLHGVVIALVLFGTRFLTSPILSRRVLPLNFARWNFQHFVIELYSVVLGALGFLQLLNLLNQFRTSAFYIAAILMKFLCFLGDHLLDFLVFLRFVQFHQYL